MRTPLTAVLGFAELLRADPGVMSEKERAGYVATIAGQAAVMSDVLEDLIVAAQAEAGLLSVVSLPINLRAQAAQVIERTRTDTRCALRMDGTAAALGDPGRVRQIIRRVLYSAELHGARSILIRLSDHDDPALLTVISDGPDPAVPDQGHGGDTAVDGSQDTADPAMLGLSVSRRLARLMNGDLEWRRTRGRGKFTLSLPTLRSTGDDGG